MAANEELIGIFSNENYEQVFLNASLMNLGVTNQSKIMTHPLEDGSEKSDHQIFELIKISIQIILSSEDYVSVYQNIEKGYRTHTLYTIQTKVNVYKNMMIDSMPHEETVETGVRLVLNFTQFEEIKTAVGIAPKYPKDSNTNKKGVQNGNQGNSNSEEKRKTFVKGLYS